jgi:uracil-DNA glycosylase family 4
MSFPTGRQAIFLKEIGVGPLWVRRDAAQAAVPTAESGAAFGLTPEPQAAAEVQAAFTRESAPPDAPDAAQIARMDWTQLKTAVAGCVKCNLCQSRTQTVFGVGEEKAKWLFVGEGPGHNEDLRGEPFVGQAGKLLDNMLLAMGLRRGDNAYIANVVKCRSVDPNGRDCPPSPDEVAACLPYLQRQIELIQPCVIVALGKTAALSLLQLDPETPVSKLRGNVHRYADLPLVVTYHPAYLLRSPADKKKVWEDLCLAMASYAA